MSSTYLTPFSKALLTGLFAGISATFVCIIYNIVWRDASRYPLFNFINVSSLIFAVNILFVIIGVVYYWFIRYIKKGEIFFIATFTIITLLCIFKVSDLHRSSYELWNLQFHHLVIAMVIIMGIAAVIGIPVMFHNKRFEDAVL